MGCGGGRMFIPYPFPTAMEPLPEEHRQSTKDILKMRLARGEITIDEYQDMLSVLQRDTHTRPQKATSHIRMP